MASAPQSIGPAVLGWMVSGVNLIPGSLGDQLGRGPTLLVFLRHFGCIFCRETVADLRAASERHEGYPGVLFFFQGSPTEGRAFLRRYWPRASAVADPKRRFYEAFGLERGSLLQTLGPSVWAARRRASGKGHQSGARSGDVWMMPGVFLVEKDGILWRHDYHHAGERPDWEAIPERLAALRERA